MRAALVALVLVHGAIHIIGFAKAFGLAKAAPLHAVITRPVGLLWLLAALGFLASAALLFLSWRSWAFVAAPTVVLSQLLIVTTWSDARFGTFANVVVLLATIVSFLDHAPNSLRSTYRREVERGLARASAAPLVTDGDLSMLPAQLQTYLRRAGVVGKPRVHDVRILWHAKMRKSPDAAWMDVQIEQYNFFDQPTRLFFIEGATYGIPFVGLHRYAGDSATMRVEVASVLPIVDGRGPEMNQSETVTLFNDMCAFAPATLIDAPVSWESLDEHRLRGTFTNAGHTISAELVFDAAGDLVDFVSNDRYESADGKTYHRYPWSTPLSDYRDFGGVRIAAKGDAIWKRPDGDFVYGKFVIDALEYNVATEPLRDRDRPGQWDRIRVPSRRPAT